MSIDIALASLALALAVTGCGRDRNLDEYKNEKAQEELVKIQSIAGTYGGAVYTEADNAPLGPITVELAGDTQTTTNPANYKSDQQAILTGNVSYGVGQNKLIVPFAQGSYNSVNKTFKAVVQISQRNTRKTEMHLSGKITGDRLDGKIEAYGYPESRGKFKLLKNSAPTSEAALGLVGGRVSPIARMGNGESSIYEGAGKFYDGEEDTIQLVLAQNNNTVEERFLDNFLPLKTAQATLKLTARSSMLFETQWDQRTGLLLGTYQSSDNNGFKAEANLRCDVIESKFGQPTTLDCTCKSTAVGGSPLVTATLRLKQ